MGGVLRVITSNNEGKSKRRDILIRLFHRLVISHLFQNLILGIYATH